MRIFSFNTTHDSAVCSLNDGEVEFFCKEERVSRKKYDNFPIQCFNLFLESNFEHIDHCLYLTPTNNADGEEFYRTILSKKYYKKLDNFENFSYLTHHRCHAMLAYVNSKFKECLVFVIDRDGSCFFVNDQIVGREAESVYLFTENDFMELIYKNFWCDPTVFNERKNIEKILQDYYKSNNVFLKSCFSIVKVYEAATTLIGHNQLENGKTMGLSSYGKSKNLEFFDQEGYAHDHLFTHLMNNIGGTPVCFVDDKDLITKNISIENYQIYADKAKNVQEETQKTALRLIESCVEKTGIKNVCVVGGYALNVVANNFYVRNRPDINFYFEPVSDDTGIPIGACFLKHREITKENPKPLTDTFYHYYDKEEKIEENLGSVCDIDAIVDILTNQQSVAIFNGHPEAGPRALGHRSILFDPRIKNGKDLVNKIKKREWYRPFAGIILEEFFEDWFYTQGIKKSENMTISFYAKEKTKKLVPSIVHVDGTCRVQTVDKNNDFLYNLLYKFYEKTSCPMLLNTSFNLAGSPLVQTKKEALDVLKESDLNYVYFCEESILVSK